MSLCILIPVHNEGGCIGPIVESIRQKGLDVVVIDDGSSDDSAEISREKGAVVLRHETKQGKGLSLQRGFAHALREEYSGVITIDGDGQHDPSDIDQFLPLIEKHPQSVITGTRMNNPKGMPWIRLLTNRFMSSVISALAKQKIPDTQCGFRYLSRDVLTNIEITSRDFEIETEVLIKASRKGFPIYSIPIKTIYRNERSKIDPFRDTVRFFAYLFREIFRR